MTANKRSSAKTQYKYLQNNCTEILTEMNKGIASFLLTLPIPMSYENWGYLHQIADEEGDGE